MPIPKPKPNFTPGPWKPSVTPDGREFGAIISTAKKQKRVRTEVEARYYGGTVVCESVSDGADARLIAAAPVMYKMLSDLRDGRYVTGEDLIGILAKIEGEE